MLITFFFCTKTTNKYVDTFFSLCFIYKTKYSEQSSGTIKNKLSTCSVRWDPSDICRRERAV